MDEYRPHSTAPPRFTIHLREPGAGSDGEGAAGSSGAGPPSRLFSLTFTLPAGYPSSQPPVIAFTGVRVCGLSYKFVGVWRCFC